MASCTHHCTTCGAHFTSLRAFDAHRHGPWDDRRCEISDELVERAGTCKLTGEVPIVGVPVFERPAAQARKAA